MLGSFREHMGGAPGPSGGEIPSLRSAEEVENGHVITQALSIVPIETSLMSFQGSIEKSDCTLLE